MLINVSYDRLKKVFGIPRCAQDDNLKVEVFFVVQYCSERTRVRRLPTVVRHGGHFLFGQHQ